MRNLAVVLVVLFLAAGIAVVFGQAKLPIVATTMGSLVQAGRIGAMTSQELEGLREGRPQALNKIMQRGMVPQSLGRRRTERDVASLAKTTIGMQIQARSGGAFTATDVTTKAASLPERVMTAAGVMPPAGLRTTGFAMIDRRRNEVAGFSAAATAGGDQLKIATRVRDSSGVERTQGAFFDRAGFIRRTFSLETKSNLEGTPTETVMTINLEAPQEARAAFIASPDNPENIQAAAVRTTSFNKTGQVTGSEDKFFTLAGSPANITITPADRPLITGATGPAQVKFLTPVPTGPGKEGPPKPTPGAASEAVLAALKELFGADYVAKYVRDLESGPGPGYRTQAELLPDGTLHTSSSGGFVWYLLTENYYKRDATGKWTLDRSVTSDLRERQQSPAPPKLPSAGMVFKDKDAQGFMDKIGLSGLDLFRAGLPPGARMEIPRGTFTSVTFQNDGTFKVVFGRTEFAIRQTKEAGWQVQKEDKWISVKPATPPIIDTGGIALPPKLEPEGPGLTGKAAGSFYAEFIGVLPAWDAVTSITLDQDGIYHVTISNSQGRAPRVENYRKEGNQFTPASAVEPSEGGEGPASIHVGPLTLTPTGTLFQPGPITYTFTRPDGVDVALTNVVTTNIDGFDYPASATGPNGEMYEFGINREGGYLGCTITATDPAAPNVTTMTRYDAQGNVMFTQIDDSITRTRVQRDTASGTTSTIQLDENGNRLTAAMTDRNGRLISFKDNTGATPTLTLYDYDADGRRTKETVLSPGVGGQIVSTTTYSYDAQGHQIGSEYDAEGNLESITTRDAEGRPVTASAFNRRDNTWATTEWDPATGQAVTATFREKSLDGHIFRKDEYRYEAGNRILTVITSYDQNDNPTSVQYLSPDGSRRVETPLVAGITRLASYDKDRKELGISYHFRHGDETLELKDAVFTNFDGQERLTKATLADGGVIFFDWNWIAAAVVGGGPSAISTSLAGYRIERTSAETGIHTKATYEPGGKKLGTEFWDKDARNLLASFDGLDRLTSFQVAPGQWAYPVYNDKGELTGYVAMQQGGGYGGGGGYPIDYPIRLTLDEKAPAPAAARQAEGQLVAMPSYVRAEFNFYYFNLDGTLDHVESGGGKPWGTSIPANAPAGKVELPAADLIDKIKEGLSTTATVTPGEKEGEFLFTPLPGTGMPEILTKTDKEGQYKRANGDTIIFDRMEGGKVLGGWQIEHLKDDGSKLVSYISAVGIERFTNLIDGAGEFMARFEKGQLVLQMVAGWGPLNVLRDKEGNVTGYQLSVGGGFWPGSSPRYGLEEPILLEKGAGGPAVEKPMVPGRIGFEPWLMYPRYGGDVFFFNEKGELTGRSTGSSYAIPTLAELVGAPTAVGVAPGASGQLLNLDLLEQMLAQLPARVSAELGPDGWRVTLPGGGLLLLTDVKLGNFGRDQRELPISGRLPDGREISFYRGANGQPTGYQFTEVQDGITTRTVHNWDGQTRSLERGKLNADGSLGIFERRGGPDLALEYYRREDGTEFNARYEFTEKRKREMIGYSIQIVDLTTKAVLFLIIDKGSQTAQPNYVRFPNGDNVTVGYDDKGQITNVNFNHYDSKTNTYWSGNYDAKGALKEAWGSAKDQAPKQLTADFMALVGPHARPSFAGKPPVPELAEFFTEGLTGRTFIETLRPGAIVEGADLKNVVDEIFGAGYFDGLKQIADALVPERAEMLENRTIKLTSSGGLLGGTVDQFFENKAGIWVSREPEALPLTMNRGGVLLRDVTARPEGVTVREDGAWVVSRDSPAYPRGGGAGQWSPGSEGTNRWILLANGELIVAPRENPIRMDARGNVVIPPEAGVYHPLRDRVDRVGDFPPVSLGPHYINLAGLVFTEADKVQTLQDGWVFQKDSPLRPTEINEARGWARLSNGAQILAPSGARIVIRPDGSVFIPKGATIGQLGVFGFPEEAALGSLTAFFSRPIGQPGLTMEGTPQARVWRIEGSNFQFYTVVPSERKIYQRDRSGRTISVDDIGAGRRIEARPEAGSNVRYTFVIDRAGNLFVESREGQLGVTYRVANNGTLQLAARRLTGLDGKSYTLRGGKLYTRGAGGRQEEVAIGGGRRFKAPGGNYVVVAGGALKFSETEGHVYSVRGNGSLQLEQIGRPGTAAGERRFKITADSVPDFVKAWGGESVLQKGGKWYVQWFSGPQAGQRREVPVGRTYVFVDGKLYLEGARGRRTLVGAGSIATKAGVLNVGRGGTISEFIDSTTGQFYLVGANGVLRTPPPSPAGPTAPPGAGP